MAGFVTGVMYLGTKSLWFDETYSITFSQASQTTVWHRFGDEINMALYHEVLHLWLALETSAFFARLLSVVFAVAAIPLLYLLVERLYGMREAALSCVLLVVSPLHIEFAQEARAYSLTLFFATAMTLIFVHALERRSRLPWLAYGVVAGASAYVHFFLGFVVLAHLVSLVFVSRHARPGRTTLVATSMLIVALAAPASYLAHRQSAAHESITAEPGMLEVVKIVKPLTGGSSLLAAVFLIVGVVFLGQAWRHRGSERSWAAALLVCWLAVPVLAAWILSQDRSVWVARYFIVVLPALVVVAAVGSLRIGRRWLSWAALVVLVVLSSRLAWTYYDDQKERWRDLAAYLVSNARSGDALVVYAPFTRIALDHYLLGTARRIAVAPLYPRSAFSDTSMFEANDPASRTLTARQVREIASGQRSYRRVWVILAHNHEQPTKRLSLALSNRAELLKRDFAGVSLRLYVGPSSCPRALRPTPRSQVARRWLCVRGLRA